MIKLTDKIIGYDDPQDRTKFNSKTIKAGLTMTFENGYTISIQFGMGNYCENKFSSKDHSKDVEIAVFDKENSFFRLPSMQDEDVKGYINMDELADYIQEVKNLK